MGRNVHSIIISNLILLNVVERHIKDHLQYKWLNRLIKCAS